MVRVPDSILGGSGFTKRVTKTQRVETDPRKRIPINIPVPALAPFIGGMAAAKLIRGDNPNGTGAIISTIPAAAGFITSMKLFGKAVKDRTAYGFYDKDKNYNDRGFWGGAATAFGATALGLPYRANTGKYITINESKKVKTDRTVDKEHKNVGNPILSPRFL